MTEAENFFRRADQLLDRLERYFPEPEAVDPDSAIAWRWRRNLGAGRLQPITRFNAISLDDLQHIEHQKKELVRNTKQFLGGVPANNALLWGPRGTGKSSLVKALLNNFAGAGLRLVEVERDDLVDLPEIVEALAGCEAKFIVFCDDLSFDEHDNTYRSLKVVLDGSVLSTPENMLVYATSNRRHLLPERMTDNLDARQIDGEIHHSEAVEEKISLSERFGLWLSFHPFDQNSYLDIVRHWLTALGVARGDEETVQRAALQWAMLHGSHSGRSAYQFAKDWAGRSDLL